MFERQCDKYVATEILRMGTPSQRDIQTTRVTMADIDAQEGLLTVCGQAEVEDTCV